MQVTFDTEIASIISNGAAGVCIADNDGLAIGCAGTLKEPTNVTKYYEPSVESIGAELHMLASRLEPESTGNITVALYGDHNKITIPKVDDNFTVKNLFHWIKEEMLKDCYRPELLIDGGTVSPGILVIINDCDWELTGGEDTALKNGDTISFISTLHGG